MIVAVFEQPLNAWGVSVLSMALVAVQSAIWALDIKLSIYLKVWQGLTCRARTAYLLA